MEQYLLYALVGAALVAVAAIFRAPIKWGLKLLLNTALGLVLLFVFNLVGARFGVTLGLNLINGLVVGIFGPIGLVLLLIIRWLTI
jgi:inhibitor of the pro-sigma K processing machinery